MKRFSESKGHLVFDWNEFFKKKSYTTEELQIADSMAERWTTCACGQQCDIIPRESGGAPKDEILATLGMNFSHQIWRMYISRNHPGLSRDYKFEAMNTLQKIEARSVELINEITAKK